jgi:hypothetical protein
MEKPEDIVNHLKDVNKSLEDLILFTRNRIEWMKNQMNLPSDLSIPAASPVKKPIERDLAYFGLVSGTNLHLN